jgi:F-type H+-transporting ATPase subunit epsilon
MKLELVTLAGIKVDEDVYEVMLPTAAGPIAVFPGHEPLVSVAVPGAIAVRFKKGDPESSLEYYAVSGGVIEVTQKLVRVLVDEADHGDDIVEAESRAALEKALKLRETAKDRVELDRATQLIAQLSGTVEITNINLEEPL